MMIITKRILLRLFRALFTFFACRVPDLPFLPLPVVMVFPFSGNSPDVQIVLLLFPCFAQGTAFSFVHANPPDCNFYISGAFLHKQFLTLCSAVCISNISTSLDKIMILEFIISYFHLASLTNCIYNSCTYQKVVTP